MSLYLIRLGRRSFGLHLKDETMAQAVFQAGILPSAIRQTLLEKSEGMLVLTSVKSGEDYLESAVDDVPDFLVWSWVGVFSSRAFRRLVELGAKEGDFLELEVEPFFDERFFAFLPLRLLDLIDFSKSEFCLKVPPDPPERMHCHCHGLRKAVLSIEEDVIPPISMVFDASKRFGLTDVIVTQAAMNVLSLGELRGIDFLRI